MNKFALTDTLGQTTNAEGRTSTPASGIGPSDLWRIILKGLPTIGLCMVAAGALTVLLLSGATPRFVASAQMLLGEQGLSDRSTFDLVEATSLTNSVIEGELAVLRSNALLLRVAQRLELDTVPEFNRDLVPEEPEEPSFLSRFFAVEEEPAPPAPETRIDLAAGTGNAELGVYKDIVGKLREAISVNQLGASFVVQVSAESENPTFAAAIANTLMDEYIAFLSDKRFKAAQRFTGWLEKRVEDLAVRLESSEREVFEYRARMEADAESRERLDQQMRELTTRLVDQRSALAEAEAMQSEVLASVKRDGALAAADLLSSDAIIQYLAELAELRQREASALLSFGEESQQVMSLARSAQQIEEAIQTEVQRESERLDNRRQVLRIVLGTLEKSLAEVSRQILAQSGEQIHLNQLQRVVDANQQVYQQFLARFKEVSEIQNLQIPDADVISYASPPPGPEFPRKTLSLGLAMLGGLAAGLAVVLLRAMAPQKLRSTEDFTRATELPVYGQMPSLGRMGGKAGKARLSDGALTRAARRLVSDLDLRAGGAARSIVVMGPAGCPDKAGVALMLGWAEAQKGRRCLVVDADLRHASLSALPDLPQAEGNLVKLLYGEAGLAQSVVPLRDLGIDLLPAVAMASDPAVAFGTERFAAIMQLLLANYDVVIFDTPEAQNGSGAFATVERADMGLFVLPVGTFVEADLGAPLRVVRAAQVRSLGLVLTGLELTETKARWLNLPRRWARAMRA